MKKLHTAATVILLAAALLLSGCAEQASTPAPGMVTGTSSDISESSSSSSEDLENPDSNTSTALEGFSTSESNQNYENDYIDYDSPDMAAISDEMDRWYENSLAEYNAYVDDLFASLDEVREPGDVPVEFTDEDLELQAILTELDRGLRFTHILLTTDRPFYIGENGYIDISPKIFIKNEGMDHSSSYRIIPENYRLEGLPVPTTAEEMRALVMEYFTEDFADNFMNYHVSTGSMTENPDGTYSVTFDENSNKGLCFFMELDGRLYWQGWSVGGKGMSAYNVLCRSAKVISRTEDTIEFSYLDDFMPYMDFVRENMQSWLSDVTRYEENAKIGVLKYERGGWRRDWNKN